MSNPIKIYIDARYASFQLRKSFKDFLNNLITSIGKHLKSNDLLNDFKQFSKNQQLENFDQLQDYLISFFNKFNINETDQFEVLKDQQKFEELIEKLIKKQFKLTSLFKLFEAQLNKYNETNQLKIQFIVPYTKQWHLDLYQRIFQAEKLFNKTIVYFLKTTVLETLTDKTALILTHNLKDYPQWPLENIIFLNSFYTNLEKKIITLEKFQFKIEIGLLAQLIPQLVYYQEQQLQLDKKTYKIGYYILSRKSEDQTNKSILLSKFPLYIVPLDLRLPLNLLNKKQYEGFLHKISDVKKSSEMLSVEEQNCLQKQFLDLYNQGSIVFCDPPTGLSVITDRISFQNAFEKLFDLPEFKKAIKTICETKKFEKLITVNVPKTLLIQETQLSSEVIIERKNQIGLKFPLICKTQVATATDNSHLLAIVLNDQGLKELSEHSIYRNETYLIQELINHNAKILKVYAIQDEIVLDKRKSLPNLTYDLVKQNQFVFDSQQSFASQLQFLANVKNIDDIYSNSQEEDLDILGTISKFIHQEINLGLYGFDIVIEDQTNDYYLVDINYYPGYKNQEGIAAKFHQYFLNQIKAFEKKN